MLAVLQAARGHFHEGLLERGALRGQFVHNDPGPRGQFGDPLDGQAGHGEPVVHADGHSSALTADQFSELSAVRGSDQHLLLGVQVDELGCRAVGKQPAPADDDEVVGGDGHLIHQVAGYENGLPLSRQALHQVPDPQHALGVEPVDRLIEKQHLRVPEQRGGDSEPLAHAEGKTAGPFPAGLVQPDHGDDLIDPPGREPLALRKAQQMVVSAAAFVHRLCLQQGAGHAHRQHQVAVRLAADTRRARVGPVKPEQQAHRGGLASAVRPEEPGHLARSHGERQIVHCQFVFVVLAEILCLDHAPTIAAERVARPWGHHTSPYYG